MRPIHFRTLALSLAVLALAASLTAQAKPNFSGTWTMVAEKSDFGGGPAPTQMTRTITHKDPTLTVVTVQIGGAMGDTTIQTTFSTDGKPQNNTVSGNPMVSVGKWDGESIVLSSKLTTQGIEVPIEDRFTLSDAGKTLTIDRKIITPEYTLINKIVMAKK